MTPQREGDMRGKSSAGPVLFVALGLLALMFVIEVLAIRHKTLTYDEGFHLRYGQNALHGDFGRREGQYDSTMPISMFNALPSFLGNELIAKSQFKDDLNKLSAARCVTILGSLLLGWLIFIWSRQLYGDRAALLSLALYVFSPDILAHGRLVTTDLYAASGYVAALYFFWRFLNQPTVWRGTVAAGWLGLSQLAKFSCVLLYPIFLIIVLLQYAMSERKTTGLPITLGRFGGWLFYFLVVSLLVINAGFFFNGTGDALRDYHFRSPLFQGLQAKSGALAAVPLPLPHAFVDGLDFVHYRVQSGDGYGNLYLLGELREKGGFPGYFFIAFLLKEPLAFQLLVLLALFSYAANLKRFHFARDELLLAVPVAFFSIYVNFFSSADLGIRYFLPVTVMLHILCGSFLSTALPNAIRRLRIAAPLLLYLIISVLSYHPHYLAYFNEIVWDRTTAYQYLADSNLDWNENRAYLNDYLNAHPEAIYEPKQPTTGTIVVGVNALTGAWNYNVTTKAEMKEQFRWLRENFKPVGQIAYSYLIYEIPPGKHPTH